MNDRDAVRGDAKSTFRNGEDLARSNRFDAICDDFEEAQRKESATDLTEFLALVPAHEQPQLFSELLAVELELAQERGDRPSLSKCLERFPTYAERVIAAHVEVDQADGG